MLRLEPGLGQQAGVRARIVATVMGSARVTLGLGLKLREGYLLANN